MKRQLLGCLLLLCALSDLAVALSCEKHSPRWPAVRAAKTSFQFVDPDNTAMKMNIVSVTGASLYALECYLNAYDHDDPQFDYSGDFECRLSASSSKEVYSTLLTEEANPTRDWQGRGRFLQEDLVGKCGQYPEYGRTRHFRLRGMNLTLGVREYEVESGSRARNIPWLRDRLRKLDLDIQVTPDDTALTEIAEPTAYLAPPLAHPDDPTDLTRICEEVHKR